MNFAGRICPKKYFLRADRIVRKEMKEKLFTPQEHILRTQIAAMALGLIDAVESNIIDTETAQKLLFRPGIFIKYEDDAEIFRLLNLGEELCWTVWNDCPEIRDVSVKEIKDLCYRILSDAPKVKVIRIK